MSKAKRKYVIHEINDLSLPKDSQCIVRIVEPRGNNLHEIVNPAGERYLVSMPSKFRKNIWVKRGDYVLTDPIQEGDKVKGEIVKILTKDHIKWYRAQNCWPSQFDGNPENSSQLLTESSEDTNETCSDDDEELFVNTNRWQQPEETDSESDSDFNESNP